MKALIINEGGYTLSNILKINSKSSTTIDMLHPTSSNTNVDKLIVGTHYNKDTLYNMFVSVINFSSLDTSIRNIESVSLCLFLDDLIYYDLSYKNIVIYKNIEYPDLSKINWISPPKVSKNYHLDVCLPYNYVDGFINIDITSLYKFSISRNQDFSITLSSAATHGTSLVKFDSSTTNHVPYLEIKVSKDIPKNTKEYDPTEEKSYNDRRKTEHHVNINDYEEDIKKLKTVVSSLNDSLNSLKEENSKLKSRLDDLSIEPIIDK